MVVKRETWLALGLIAGFMACVSQAQILGPGVVVERVEKGSEAERAGIRNADVLLAWVRGDARGEISSPFDLAQIETEQSPLERLALEGLGGRRKQSWTLEKSGWGIAVRPNFSPALLVPYLAGRRLARAGNLKNAARKWREIALRLPGTQPAWLCSWLLYRAGEASSDAHQWRAADLNYGGAVRRINAGDRFGVQILLAWGNSFQQRGDWVSAEKYDLRALEQCRTSGCEALTGIDILSRLGSLAGQHGQWPKAGDYFSQALPIAEKRIPGSMQLASILKGLGMAAGFRGNLDEGEKYLRQALAIQEKLSPESLDVAAVVLASGMIAWTRGDWQLADGELRQALVIYEKRAPGSTALATTLNDLGVAAQGRGDLVKAEEYFNRALAIHRKQDPRGLSASLDLGNLGGLSFDRGDLVATEAYIRQALAIQQKQEPGSADVAESLTYLGLVVREQHNLAKAEEYFQQACAIHQKQSSASLHVARCLENLGLVAQDRNEMIKAEDYFHRALAIEEKDVPGSLFLASTLDVLGDFSRNRGDLVEAEADYRRALAITARLAPQSTQHAQLLGNLASLARDQQQIETAAQLFRQALDAIEGQIARLGGGESTRSGFRAQYYRIYESYIDLLVEQGQSDLAFQVLEHSRARTLLDTLAVARVDIRAGADRSLLERERELRQSYKVKSERRAQWFNQPHAEEEVASIERDLVSILQQYEQVEGRIRDSSPSYAALTQPQPLDAKEIQRQLPDNNTVLLEYSLGQEHSYLFAVTSDSLNAYPLPKQEEVEKAAREVYDILTARGRAEKNETAVRYLQRVEHAEAQYAEAAAKLSRLILGPVARLLQRKRLLIVTDGILQYIPFAALPAPDSQEGVPLANNHEIVVLPSASVLPVLKREHAFRTPPTKSVAVLADPVFSVDDERLHANPKSAAKVDGASSGTVEPGPVSAGVLVRSAAETGAVDGNMHLPRLFFTRREAESILEVAPASESMKALDFQASRATASDPQLARYRIIHFATHGLLNSEHPQLSGLVLSLVDEHGRPQDGFLRLTDIYNLRFSADLVVLSGCQTALGREIKGEGLVGITRGFMYAGASRVLASLWKVDDVATAELMGRFYRGILQENLSPAAALQKAQVEMWRQKRWTAPYYWAGFVLQGEW